jgi:hypothetical protein
MPIRKLFNFVWTHSSSFGNYSNCQPYDGPNTNRCAASLLPVYDPHCDTTAGVRFCVTQQLQHNSSSVTAMVVHKLHSCKKIWGSHTSLDENSHLLGCDCVQGCWCWTMKVLHSFKISPSNTIPHPIPEARIFNLHLLVCLCRPNSCNTSKTKTNAALNCSLCTPLANDTTQMNHCLKIQVFWDTHSVTSLMTWISMTSTNRTLNLTSPPLRAQTARFVTHHWASLTLYCPLVLVAGGVGCSGMQLAAGPPAKACDWMQGMLWPSSPQVLVSSLQQTASHLLQHTHTHTHRKYTSRSNNKPNTCIKRGNYGNQDIWNCYRC